MKFAKQLQSQAVPEWREHYINYKGLKKLLKAVERLRKEHGDSAVPQDMVLETSRAFLAQLQVEVAKVNRMVTEKKDGFTRDKAAIDEMRARAAGTTDAKGASDLRKAASAGERELWRAESQLREFAELNYTAAYKSMKKHDKVTKLKHMDTVLALVEQQPFFSLIDQVRLGGGVDGSGDHTPLPLIARRDKPGLRGSSVSSLDELIAHATVAAAAGATDVPHAAAGAPPLRRSHSDVSGHSGDGSIFGSMRARALPTSQSVGGGTAGSQADGLRGLARTLSMHAAAVHAGTAAPAHSRGEASFENDSENEMHAVSSPVHTGVEGGDDDGYGDGEGLDTDLTEAHEEGEAVDTVVAAGIASLLNHHLGIHAPQTPAMTGAAGRRPGAGGAPLGAFALGPAAALPPLDLSEDYAPVSLSSPSAPMSTTAAASATPAAHPATSAGARTAAVGPLASPGADDQHSFAPSVGAMTAAMTAAEEEAANVADNSDTAILSRLQHALSAREGERKRGAAGKRSLRSDAFAQLPSQQSHQSQHQQLELPHSGASSFSLSSAFQPADAGSHGAPGRAGPTHHHSLLPTITESHAEPAHDGDGASSVGGGGGSSAHGSADPGFDAGSPRHVGAQRSLGALSAASGASGLTALEGRHSRAGSSFEPSLVVTAATAAASVSGAHHDPVTPSRRRVSSDAHASAAAHTAVASPLSPRTQQASASSSGKPARSGGVRLRPDAPPLALVPDARGDASARSAASSSSALLLLSPTAAGSLLSPALSWDAFNADVASTMARQFDRTLREAHEFTSSALKVVSPELIHARSERLKRLAKFTLALLRAQRKVGRLVEGRASLRQLHDAILAAKLELFRYGLKVVIREVELVFPEGAAALEHLVQAHYACFAMYMSERVRTPTKHRIELLQRMQAGGAGGAARARGMSSGSPLESGPGSEAAGGSADSATPGAPSAGRGGASARGRARSSSGGAHRQRLAAGPRHASHSQPPQGSPADGVAPSGSSASGSASGGGGGVSLHLLHDVETSTKTLGRALLSRFGQLLAQHNSSNNNQQQQQQQENQLPPPQQPSSDVPEHAKSASVGAGVGLAHVHAAAISAPPSSPPPRQSALLTGHTLADAVADSPLPHPGARLSQHAAPHAAPTAPPVRPGAVSSSTAMGADPLLDKWHLPPAAGPSATPHATPKGHSAAGGLVAPPSAVAPAANATAGVQSASVTSRPLFKLGSLLVVNKKRAAPTLPHPTSASGSSEERRTPALGPQLAPPIPAVAAVAPEEEEGAEPSPVSKRARFAGPDLGATATAPAGGSSSREERGALFNKLRIARDGSLMVADGPAAAPPAALPPPAAPVSAPTAQARSGSGALAASAASPPAGHAPHHPQALVPDRYRSMRNVLSPAAAGASPGAGLPHSFSALSSGGGSSSASLDLATAVMGRSGSSGAGGGGSSGGLNASMAAAGITDSMLSLSAHPSSLALETPAGAHRRGWGDATVSAASAKGAEAMPSLRLGRSDTIGGFDSSIGLSIDAESPHGPARGVATGATLVGGAASLPSAASSVDERAHAHVHPHLHPAQSAVAHLATGASAPRGRTPHGHPLQPAAHPQQHHGDGGDAASATTGRTVGSDALGGGGRGGHGGGGGGGPGSVDLRDLHGLSRDHFTEHEEEEEGDEEGEGRRTYRSEGGGSGSAAVAAFASPTRAAAPSAAAGAATAPAASASPSSPVPTETSMAAAKHALMWLLGVGERDPFARGGRPGEDLLLHLGFGLPLPSRGGGGAITSDGSPSRAPPQHGLAGPPWRYIASRAWARWRPASAEWLPEYKVSKYLWPDVLAGVTIGVLLLPQGLAYATLAGLPPIYGVYTGIPAILYALLGTSRHAAIGPMSIPALLIASGIASMPAPPTGQAYIDAVMGMTLLCGALLLGMGWANMGFIVRFISRPVLSGFASASAVLTMCSAVKDLLGADVPRSQVIYEYVPSIADALPRTHAATLVTGAAAILLLWRLPKFAYSKKLPAPLQVVTGFIVLFAIWWAVAGGDDSASARNAIGVRLIGHVPAGFPTFRLPAMRREDLPSLMTTAVTVSFVGFIESIAVAKMYAVKHGYDIVPSSELKALGVTNVIGACFGSFPVMGAFGRSAVNDSTGARSQLSGVVSALTVALLLLLVTPALYYLPNSVLAAVIIMAVSSLVDVSGARRLWAVDKRDFLTMLAAFAATLCLGVLLGVIVAMAFSLVLFIALTTQPTVEELGRLTGTVIYRHIGMVGVAKVPEVKVIKFLAPLFFANCSVLKDRLLLELGRRKELPPRLQWRALVLCFASVSSIDSTSIQTLDEVRAECHAAGVPLLLSSPNALVEAALHEAGFEDRLGGPRFMFRRVHEAVRAVLLGEVTRHDLPPAPAKGPGAGDSAKGGKKVGKGKKGSKKSRGGAKKLRAGDAVATTGGGLLVRARRRVLALPLLQRVRGLGGTHTVHSDSEPDDSDGEKGHEEDVERGLPASSSGGAAAGSTCESYEVVLLGRKFDVPTPGAVLAKWGLGRAAPHAGQPLPHALAQRLTVPEPSASGSNEAGHGQRSSASSGPPHQPVTHHLVELVPLAQAKAAIAVAGQR